MALCNSRNLIALGCLAILLVGCETAPDPQKIGVFASTNHGLVELTVYGEQEGMTSYDVRKLKQAPTAAKVSQFYVNMPDSQITNSKLFWLTKLDNELNEEGLPPLNASIEVAKGNMYRIKCAQMEEKRMGTYFSRYQCHLGRLTGFTQSTCLSKHSTAALPISADEP